MTKLFAANQCYSRFHRLLNIPLRPDTVSGRADLMKLPRFEQGLACGVGSKRKIITLTILDVVLMMTNTIDKLRSVDPPSLT
jgi:hypothetical protein